jgi:hypothetical protein
VNALLDIAITLALVAGAWLVWQHWTPLLRYRAKRYYGRIKRVCKRYLDGLDSLEEATRQMAALFRNPPNLGSYQEDFPPFGPLSPGHGDLISVNLIFTPEGYSPTDPRIEQLLERAMMETRQERDT